MKNGDVGWVSRKQVEGFYDFHNESRQRQLRFEEPMVSVHESPDGRYMVKETSGMHQGVRFRIVEEKYAIEENVDISAVPINHTQVSRAMYPSDIPQEELQQAE